MPPKCPPNSYRSQIDEPQSSALRRSAAPDQAEPISPHSYPYHTFDQPSTLATSASQRELEASRERRLEMYRQRKSSRQTSQPVNPISQQESVGIGEIAKDDETCISLRCYTPRPGEDGYGWSETGFWFREYHRQDCYCELCHPRRQKAALRSKRKASTHPLPNILSNSPLGYIKHMRKRRGGERTLTGSLPNLPSPPPWDSLYQPLARSQVSLPSNVQTPQEQTLHPGALDSDSEQIFSGLYLSFTRSSPIPSPGLQSDSEPPSIGDRRQPSQEHIEGLTHRGKARLRGGGDADTGSGSWRVNRPRDRQANSIGSQVANGIGDQGHEVNGSEKEEAPSARELLEMIDDRREQCHGNLKAERRQNPTLQYMAMEQMTRGTILEPHGNKDLPPNQGQQRRRGDEIIYHLSSNPPLIANRLLLEGNLGSDQYDFAPTNGHSPEASANLIPYSNPLKSRYFPGAPSCENASPPHASGAMPVDRAQRTQPCPGPYSRGSPYDVLSHNLQARYSLRLPKLGEPIGRSPFARDAYEALSYTPAFLTRRHLRGEERREVVFKVLQEKRDYFNSWIGGEQRELESRSRSSFNNSNAPVSASTSRESAVNGTRDATTLPPHSSDNTSESPTSGSKDQMGLFRRYFGPSRSEDVNLSHETKEDEEIAPNQPLGVLNRHVASRSSSPDRNASGWARHNAFSRMVPPGGRLREAERSTSAPSLGLSTRSLINVTVSPRRNSTRRAQCTATMNSYPQGDGPTGG
ncbi:uncharacterized protein BDR25DRAFT_313248 [Lindgomyces ingoldianus]|uniref:Uncharacterized protein n=1 Tax=Lindgomyces ingoldianus TaxID=673940 RepID=A0ACB6R144_9PLEO|nr:uncharacterized protein BDR25DRAFT_313248 [Lindgomyces ingoldianus]KAF2472042.1 hypothetical protein BDR25DRAFT_313248 [Lindgomyces ingoldianus]